MGSTKLLVTGAVIAVLGAAAILIPGIAAGVPLAGINPVSTVVAPEDGPGNNGRGNAFGHDRDSGDFPGNRKGDDARDDSDHEGGGNGWGHHKDDPDFPGNNGRNQDNPQDDSDD
jgi:hypothetical protein